MKHRDQLSKHYESKLLDGYDCLDRIILNCYCPMLHSGGGMRYWYRLLKGDDSTLSTNTLMRFAGRFSRKVEAYAKKHAIPLVKFKKGERKHEAAEKMLPKDPNFTGIFAIFIARATAYLWDVRRYGRHGMDIKRKKELSYVNHYYFHIIDKQWGHLTVKICAHPPFKGQVFLNGHEWVARNQAVAGLELEKQDNCFTDYNCGETLTSIADTLKKKGQLAKVCNRWIYRCLYFALSFTEQKQSQFRYQYSVFQIEHSRNLLFKRGRFVDQVFQGIINLTRPKLDMKRLRTMFGRTRRPYEAPKTRASRRSDPQVRIETPDYNLTIFKITFGKLTLKLYDKGERTLRAEVVVNDAKALKCKRSVSNFPQIVQALEQLMNRFLDNLYYLHVALVDEMDLNVLAQPSVKGANRLAGIHLAQPRMQDVLKAVLALSIQPGGYKAKDLAEKMKQMGWHDYAPHKASYDLRKLRGKNLVLKHSARKYVNTPLGIQTMVALLSLVLEQIPCTLALLQNDQTLNDKELSPLEQHYFNIKKEIADIRAIYGIYYQAA